MGKTYKLNQTGPTIQDVLNKVEPTLSKGDIATSDEVVHKGTSSSTGIAETLYGDKTFANYIKLQQGGPEAGSKPVKIFGDGLSSQFMVEGKTLTLFDVDNVSNITMYDFDSGKIEKRWKTSYGYDNSYLLLPNSKGTSANPATIATIDDVDANKGTKLYKHIFQVGNNITVSLVSLSATKPTFYPDVGIITLITLANTWIMANVIHINIYVSVANYTGIATNSSIIYYDSSNQIHSVPDTVIDESAYTVREL